MKTRIRALREDNDFTQEDIARYLNMSQTGYSKYETGQSEIPVYILIRLAKFYNVSLDYIAGLTRSKERYRY